MSEYPSEDAPAPENIERGLMTAEEGFLADIIENPDDDAPRLIYADWLEDRGQPGDSERAEFIRLQCRLAQMPQGTPERATLELREHALTKRHEKEWSRIMKIRRASSSIYIRFRRGMPEIAGMCSFDFVHAETEKILRLDPTLRALELESNGVPIFQEAVNRPYLASFTELKLMGDIGDHAALALAGSPYVTRLRHLDLSRNNMTDQGALALAASRSFNALRTLILSGNHLTSYGIRAIRNSPFLRQLKQENLHADDQNQKQERDFAAETEAARRRKLDEIRAFLG